MTFPRNSLGAFFQHARSGLVQAVNGKKRVNVVIGNESADLDSLTSSLLFAYIRSIAPPRDAFAPLYIPLLNIPSSGVRLRPEFTAVCRHANISPSNLITLDDFPKYSEVLENVQFILVDHNKLQGELGDRYHSNVKGVIDHHDEENAVPRHTQPEPRIIEKCGSCTSLVARFCTPSWDAMSSSSLSAGAAHGQGDAAVDDSIVTEGWDAQMAQMALASILIDTANLTAPGKVQTVDEEAVEYLEAKIQKSPRYSKSWNRNQVYHEIDEAKRNIDALSLEEVLKKDYKQWTEKNLNLGISSVVKPLIYLTKKAIVETKHSDFQDTLAQFMESHSLDIFAIMTTSTSEEGEFTRELLVQAKEASFPALHEFVKKAVLALRLEEILIENIDTQREPKPGQIWRKIWLQKDVSQSRKQVAPMLRESIRSA